METFGASEDRRFQGRVLAATHVDLAERRQQGRFRDDLYYRLDVLTVRVPSLDERKKDIPALAEHFLRTAPRQVALSDGAKEALMKRSWAGNVRELRNLIYRLSAFVDTDTIEASDVQEYKSADRAPAAALPVEALTSLSTGLSLRATKKQNVNRLLQNQVRLLEIEGLSAEEICRILDVGRASLFRLKAGKGEEEKS